NFTLPNLGVAVEDSAELVEHLDVRIHLQLRRWADLSNLALGAELVDSVGANLDDALMAPAPQDRVDEAVSEGQLGGDEAADSHRQRHLIPKAVLARLLVRGVRLEDVARHHAEAVFRIGTLALLGHDHPLLVIDVLDDGDLV